MPWKVKFCLLLIFAIPAFSGFPLKNFDVAVVEGLKWSWVIYLFTIHLVLRMFLGGYRYGKITGIAALITLPVVYSGAGLSFMLWLVQGGSQADAFSFGAHYLHLTVTMLTVIPLSLSFVILLPFNAIEQQLLQRTDGVTPMEKRLLMAMRVFNHIFFDVLPTILEVLREESAHSHRSADSNRHRERSCIRHYFRKLMSLNSKMVQIGVEGICAAMQYIPLWAVELSQLPERKKTRRTKKQLKT